MTAGWEGWQEAQRAWERLAQWRPLADGDHALRALADVGLLRRLLDQLEFEAVRTSRRQGKSWAEIAIKLGVTRQSAWERWRDVDDADSPRLTEPESGPDALSRITADAADELARGLVGDPEAGSAQVSAPLARRRRTSSVVVPNVIGMSCDQAWRALQAEGLVGVGPNPDGPPLAELDWPDGVVTDQSPESGAKVPPGSTVRVWVDRGGGAGVREPRMPPPGPKPALKMRDETVDEAVG
jgi:transposase-like protein